VRFDELILQDGDEELRVPFHPQLTVLSGLGQEGRTALAEGILDALTGGPEPTVLRYVDGTGVPITLTGRDGRVEATDGDGAPAPAPLGSIVPDAASLRRLVLITARDLGGVVRRVREDESPELREARDMLEELARELEAATGRAAEVAALQGQLDALDAELRAARDGVARREYAQVLAQLERVRAEAAALQSGTAGIESDRLLLGKADAARALATRWTKAAERVAALRAEVPPGPRLDPGDLEALAQIPDAAPTGAAPLIDALAAALADRDALDQRLQALAVSTLPAPSDPLVADLGLLDQRGLWHTASRLTEANDAMQRVQVSLGGLEVDDMGPPSALIEEIETAHRDVEDADHAATQAWMPGLAGTVAGALAGVLGLATTPVLAGVGLLGAGVAAVAGIARPRARLAAARKVEQEALGRAEATSYLGFHIRRVEASVDPKLREMVEATTVEQRGALAVWTELVGPDVDVAAVLDLRDEIEAYSAAVQNLGDTADELEQLRLDLAERAEPTLAAARRAVLDACGPYGVGADDLDDPAALTHLLTRQCERGARARAELQVAAADADEQAAAARLDELLLQLGFDAGQLDARVGALDWAVSRAQEREAARHQARPRAEIDAELAALQETAARLRQPEWATVTAADAATPDIPELEARRDELVQALATARAEVDIDRLADRHAAVERRVAALEARSGDGTGADASAVVSEVHQHLVARLTVAAQAAPHGDPVPVVLDEALQRVPADRSWDLLDLLLRLAEDQQLVYLTDDAFVAAWARQRALDGSITLLEPEPEPV
jgi:hypothetical protein